MHCHRRFAVFQCSEINEERWGRTICPEVLRYFIIIVLPFHDVHSWCYLGVPVKNLFLVPNSSSENYVPQSHDHCCGYVTLIS